MVEIDFKEGDGDDFEKLIKEHKDIPTFVIFNATWCGSCKALKPQLQKRCQNNKFNFISVDADENPDLSEKFEVQAIPYVVVYVKGERVFEFSGNKKEKIDKAFEVAKNN